jgi:hypothetical protein
VVLATQYLLSEWILTKSTKNKEKMGAISKMGLYVNPILAIISARFGGGIALA